MKKLNLNIGTFALVLMATILLNSCSNISISSRRYNKGYHIEWASKSSKGLETSPVVKSKNKIVAEKINLDYKKSISEALFQIEKQSLPDTNQALVDLNSLSVPSQIVILENEANKPVKELQIESKTVSKKTKLFSKVSKQKSKEMTDELFLVLLVILALILPPVAVYFFEGSWTSRVTLSLILTIAAIVLGGIFWGSMGISLYIVPVIHALIVILKG